MIVKVALSVMQWMVGYLTDNHVKDSHFYLMTVYTGLRRGAGTRSNVGFILTGHKGNTGVRQLSDGERVSVHVNMVLVQIELVSSLVF